MNLFTKLRIKRSRGCLLLVRGEPHAHIAAVLELWGNPAVVRRDRFGLVTADKTRIRVARKRRVAWVGRPEPGFVVVDTTVGWGIF